MMNNFPNLVKYVCGACLIVLLVISLNLSTLNNVAEAIVKTSGSLPKTQKSNLNLPEITPQDLIYNQFARSVFVLPEYKLIFFTFPKVACSEWKRMFMRVNGNKNWCLIRGFNAHDPKKNQIKVLNDYEPEIATAMMTSPLWTRAAIVREPKERVLSAFLDKAVKEDYYVKHCCKKLPSEEEKEKCIKNEKNFESFLHYVTTYTEECFDVHWQPQLAKIDKKWWPFINLIGHQNNLQHDAKMILQHLTSARDEVEGRTAWDRYGKTGWGNSDECENRTHAFLEENSSTHKLDTGSHLMEWYTPKAEKMVEEHWAIEWSEENVQFPKVELFPKDSVEFSGV